MRGFESGNRRFGLVRIGTQEFAENAGCAGIGSAHSAAWRKWSSQVFSMVGQTLGNTFGLLTKGWGILSSIGSSLVFW